MRIKTENHDDSVELGKVANCPFCGNVDDLEITDKRFYNKLVNEHGSSLLSIKCKCGTELKLFDIPDNNYLIGIGILISKWNNRR